MVEQSETKPQTLDPQTDCGPAPTEAEVRATIKSVEEQWKREEEAREKMEPEYLFLGGPADGRRLRVPNGRDHWRVAIPQPIPPSVFPSDSPPSIDTGSDYVRVRFPFGETRRYDKSVWETCWITVFVPEYTRDPVKFAMRNLMRGYSTPRNRACGGRCGHR